MDRDRNADRTCKMRGASFGVDVSYGRANVRLVGNALELGFIELLSECFTLSDQAGVGSDKLLELIKDQHSSPALVRYGERIIGNKFGAEGGFTLGGGIVDAR